MRVEHTSQLIQLILNSVLLVMAGVMVLTCALARHGALVDRLQTLQRDRRSEGSQEPHDLTLLKLQLHPVRRHYRLTHTSLLAALYALLCSLGSALAVSCRTLIHWNGLIAIALVLFIASSGLLLLSIGLILLDVHAVQRSLWRELVGLPSESRFPLSLFGARTRRRSKSSRRILQKISSQVKQNFSD